MALKISWANRMGQFIGVAKLFALNKLLIAEIQSSLWFVAQINAFIAIFVQLHCVLQMTLYNAGLDLQINIVLKSMGSLI